ncbi:methyltransferase [Streptomyces sp. ATMOS53]
MEPHDHTPARHRIVGPVVIADDRMRAATAHRLARAGTSLLWRGDFQGARRLLRAMDRRIGAGPASPDPAEAFRLHRRARAHRARVLDRLLVELADDHTVALRRAPDVREACHAAYGPPNGPALVPLRELLGVIGAHQWRLKGVEVPALGARVHPHYGVFAPTRSEYVDLVADAPLPATVRRAPRRGHRVRPGHRHRRPRGGPGRARRREDRRNGHQPRALTCAEDNAHRLGLGGRITLAPGLYPPGRADLVVCNPPWLPGRPPVALELGVYDEGNGMLRGFLGGLMKHLRPGGEGWPILSDLAEHLVLRTREELLELIETAGLRVVDRIDVRPRHRRASDVCDPLHAARAAETTTLWRLRPAP